MAVSTQFIVKSVFVLVSLGSFYWLVNEAPTALKEGGYFGLMVASLAAFGGAAITGLLAFLMVEMLDDNDEIAKQEKNAAKKK